MFDTREAATVESEFEDRERWITHCVMLKFSGGGQGFGTLVMDEDTLADWKASLCSLFRVSSIEQIVGRHCFILRSWPSWGERIEGLEVDGRRFTVTGFCRKHWPEKARTPLERRSVELRDDIDRHAMRIRECVQRLTNVNDGYVDWEMPSESVERKEKT